MDAILRFQGGWVVKLGGARLGLAKPLGDPWLHLEIALCDCGTPRCLDLD